jgi:hypothetical protein
MREFIFRLFHLQRAQFQRNTPPADRAEGGPEKITDPH